jgi:hypothetical protein
MPRGYKKMKGGLFGFGDSTSTTSGSSMFGSLGSTLSGWGSTLSQDSSNLWNKTKNAASGLTSGLTSYGSSTPTTYGTPTGGRKKTRRRHMRGGNFKDNTPTTGLAAHASPISGVNTAQPHNWVGGKTKRRRHSKSRRHRKH